MRGGTGVAAGLMALLAASSPAAGDPGAAPASAAEDVLSAPAAAITDSVPDPETAAGSDSLAAADSARGDDDAPLSPDVLTASELQRSGALVIGEALSRLPGVEVIERGYLGSETEAWLEGFPADHRMVLLDGVPTADPNRYTLNLDMLPAAGIETIAIERGPLLLEHGTRAVGGVIRVITRRDAPGPPRSRLMFATGSFGTETFRGGFRRGFGGGRHGVSLSLNRVSASGYRDVGDYSLFQFHFRMRATISPRLRLRVSGAGASANLTAAGASGGASPDGRTKEGRQQVRVTASILPDGPVPLEATVFFASGRRDSLDVGTGARVARREGDRAEIRVKGRWRPASGLSLIAGVGEEFLTAAGGEARAFSFFSGATWSPLRLASIEAAARREVEGGRYSAWSGAARVEREIAGGLSLFSSWASVRHRPALEGRTETTPLGREERFEAGLTIERGRFVHHLSRFRRRVGEEGAVGAGTSVPSGDLETDGWRVSGRVRIMRWLFLTAAYQRLHEGGAPAPGRFVARHLIGGSLEAERALAGDVLGLEARLSGRYVKGREGPAPEGAGEYGIADLNIGLRFVDIVFFATIRNLGDTRPEIAGGFPVAGRTARFGFTWDFLD